MMSLGELIRSHRQALGLTAAQLAEKVGAHPTYLQGMESGTKRPLRAEKLVKIARIVGLDPDEVCFLVGRIPPDLKAILLSDRQAVVWLRAYLRHQEDAA